MYIWYRSNKLLFDYLCYRNKTFVKQPTNPSSIEHHKSELISKLSGSVRKSNARQKSALSNKGPFKTSNRGSGPLLPREEAWFIGVYKVYTLHHNTVPIGTEWQWARLSHPPPPPSRLMSNIVTRNSLMYLGEIACQLSGRVYFLCSLVLEF